MQICAIHLKNIKSHIDTQLTFAGGINVLSGANGAGKSTIFEAIGYALFGVDARDFVSNAERFIAIGAKRGEVAVTFQTSSGHLWRASRTVGTPAKWLLAEDKQGVFEVEEHARLEETESRIAELLGLNNGRPLAEQFKLVIGPFQNDFLGPFIIKQPVKRQEAFDEILGIDAWRKTYKGTAALLSTIQEKSRILSAEIALLQEQLAVLPGKSAELQELLLLQERLRSQILVVEEQVTSTAAQLDDLDGKEKALTSLDGELKALEERIADGTEKIASQVQRVAEAQAAMQAVAAARPGKEAYDRLEVVLAELRGKEQRRRLVEQHCVTIDLELQRLAQQMCHEQEEIAQTVTQLRVERAALDEARTAVHVDVLMTNAVAQLPVLRQEHERIKAEIAQLDGRRSVLAEGKEKLAEGICPYLLEACPSCTDHAPYELFVQKDADLDKVQRDLQHRSSAISVQLFEAEAAEKEVTARGIRLLELNKQSVVLDERMQRNEARRLSISEIALKQRSIESLLAEQRQELLPFAQLDEEIARTEQERKKFQAAYDCVTAHQKDADDFAQRSQTLIKWQHALAELDTTRSAKQALRTELVSVYDAVRHQELRQQREALLSEVATVRQQLKECAATQSRVQEEIDALRTVQETVAGKTADCAAFADKERLVKFLRNQVFKQVSAQLSERFREEISLRADRIYRTIAEADEELVWGDNYRVVLRDQVDGQLRERCDDQLSGGQMMSAVVALRLALLQTIGARIAFFDEPTSNLDSVRRENLAQAFRAIDVGREEIAEHWYDQLFLVSHDVAFTEITDQIIQIGGEAL